MRTAIRFFIVAVLSSLMVIIPFAVAKDKKGGGGGGGAKNTGGGGGGGSGKPAGGGGGAKKPTGEGGGNAGPKNAGGGKMAGPKHGGGAKPHVPKSLVKKHKRSAGIARNTARPIANRDRRLVRSDFRHAKSALLAGRGNATTRRSGPRTARYDVRRAYAHKTANASRVRSPNLAANSNASKQRIAGDLPTPAQKDYGNALKEKRHEADELKKDSKDIRGAMHHTNDQLAKLNPDFAKALAQKRAEEAKFDQKTQREDAAIWRLKNKIGKDPNDAATYQKRVDKIVQHEQQQKQDFNDSKEHLRDVRKEMTGDPKIDTLKNRLHKEFDEFQEEEADFQKSKDEYKKATQNLLNESGGGK